MFGQGNANGKREYSSTTVNKYALRDAVGRGPFVMLLVEAPQSFHRLRSFDKNSSLLSVELWFELCASSTR
jgi:hypothetical protein